MTNQTIAEAGAYFMAGAIDALAGGSDYNFDELSGWCGFVTELCQYAEYSDALAYAGYGRLVITPAATATKSRSLLAGGLPCTTSRAAYQRVTSVVSGCSTQRRNSFFAAMRLLSTCPVL